MSEELRLGRISGLLGLPSGDSGAQTAEKALIDEGGKKPEFKYLDKAVGISKVYSLTISTTAGLQETSIRLIGRWLLKGVSMSNQTVFDEPAWMAIYRDGEDNYMFLDSGETSYMRTLQWHGELLLEGDWHVAGSIYRGSGATTARLKVIAEKMDPGV
mgnify:CR=1 FL=1